MSAIAVWEVRWSKRMPAAPGKMILDPADSSSSAPKGRSAAALREKLTGLAKKWVFQEERGDGGYEHFQGRISLFKRRRKNEVMELMNRIGCPVPEYLEPTVSSEHQKAAFYAMKADTRTDGPWSNKDEVIWCAPEYEAPDEWYPWQKTVLLSRGFRDQRTINLVIDPTGNNGKTMLAMHMECKKLATVLPVLSDAKEICECVCDELMLAEERDPRVVIMDLPRAMSKKTLAGVFCAIENIKNGKVVDRRYSLKKWFFRPPQVWVFSNRVPNLAYLSADRWRAWRIAEDRSLKPIILKKQGNDGAIDDE